MDTPTNINNALQKLFNKARQQVEQWLNAGIDLTEISRRVNKLRFLQEQKELAEAFRRQVNQMIREKFEGKGYAAKTQVEVPDVAHELRHYLQRELTRAVASGGGAEQFKQRLEAHEFGDVQTLANTAISQFNNNLTFEQAEVAGITLFEYFGPVAAITRPFCRAHAGKIFTLEQIQKMDNGQGLSVRESCGGYNCRHEWVTITEDVYSAKELESKKISSQIKPQKIGKQVYLMDEQGEERLFKVNRTLWVERERSEKGKEWSLFAKPLAKAHDGLNPLGVNLLSDGIWVNRMRIDPEGNKTVSNFTFNFKQNKVDFPSVRSYRSQMHALINNPNAKIYKDNTHIYIHDKPRRNVMVIEKVSGKIETFFKLDAQKNPRYFEDKTKLTGSLKDYIGDF